MNIRKETDMGYYAMLMEDSLTVKDAEGLRQMFIKDPAFFSGKQRDLEYLFSANLIGVEELLPDGRLLLMLEDTRYRREDWEKITPFAEGYLQWIGEDNTIWRDVFEDGKMKVVYPKISWKY